MSTKIVVAKVVSGKHTEHFNEKSIGRIFRFEVVDNAVFWYCINALDGGEHHNLWVHKLDVVQVNVLNG